MTLILYADVCAADLPGIFARYKFDEITGKIAYDSVGNHHGIYSQNVSSVAGKVNKASYFGENQVLTIDQLPNVSTNGVSVQEISISFWFKTPENYRIYEFFKYGRLDIDFLEEGCNGTISFCYNNA